MKHLPGSRLKRCIQSDDYELLQFANEILPLSSAEMTSLGAAKAMDCLSIFDLVSPIRISDLKQIAYQRHVLAVGQCLRIKTVALPFSPSHRILCAVVSSRPPQ